MKLYYKLFLGYYLARIYMLANLEIPYEACPDGMERRKIFYRFNFTIDRLYRYGFINDGSYAWLMLKLTDNVRFSDDVALFF